MAKLTAGKRNKLPKGDFAGPGRSFPVEDKGHAKFAKAIVGRQVKSGKMSAAEGERIDAKANKVLHGGKTTPVKTDRGTFHMKENKPAAAKPKGRTAPAFGGKRGF